MDDQQPTTTPDPARRPLPTAAVVVAAVVALVAAVLIGFAGNDDDGADVLSRVPTFPPTTAPTTTAAPVVPGSEATTTTLGDQLSPAGLDLSTAVWPDPETSQRFTDPAEAARSFAVDLVGFADPQLGEYTSPTGGAAGSIDVRPTPDGPVTAVSVAQDGTDGSWWVTGAVTGNVLVNDPLPNSVVSSPMPLRGSSLAFEGTVDVVVHADGAASPAGTGFVTGGSTEVAPFDGQVSFTPGDAAAGSVLFRIMSAADGSVSAATVVRVRFG